MTNLDNILKSRHITLLTKVHLVKAIIYSIVMYGYESQTIKKAERWRIDALKLWCWRRLLRVPWAPRRSNQSILKEINPEYTLGGRRADSLKSKAGKVWRQVEKGRTARDGWMTSLTQWTWFWALSGKLWSTGKGGVFRSRTQLSQTQQNNWTTATIINMNGLAS